MINDIKKINISSSDASLAIKSFEVLADASEEKEVKKGQVWQVFPEKDGLRPRMAIVFNSDIPLEVVFVRVSYRNEMLEGNEGAIIDVSDNQLGSKIFVEFWNPVTLTNANLGKCLFELDEKVFQKIVDSYNKRDDEESFGSFTKMFREQCSLEVLEYGIPSASFRLLRNNVNYGACIDMNAETQEYRAAAARLLKNDEIVEKVINAISKNKLVKVIKEITETDFRIEFNGNCKLYLIDKNNKIINAFIPNSEYYINFDLADKNIKKMWSDTVRVLIT